MDTPLIIPLDTVSQSDVALVGGKAATLGKLHRAGFPVPAGLCITTDTFRLALADRQAHIQQLLRSADLYDPATAQSAAAAIAALLSDLTLPPMLAEALAEAMPQLADPTTPLAVRSSAIGEDGALVSYAGQYATSLGVRGLAAVQAAILAGWRSFFSANALAARAAQEELTTSEGMALLIQPLLAAECAGVAFSVDPVQERRDRLVINVAWGLGAGVVDGTVANDTIWVRRADLDVFAALSGLSEDEAKAVANRLVDSEETPLTQLIDELYALAALARQEAAVAAVVAQAPPTVMAQLHDLPQAAPFLTRFQKFLDHYGERTGDGWGSEVTLAMPTWREEPSIVLALIAPYLATNVTAPAISRARARQARETEVAALCAACSDPAVVAEFRRQLAYARKVSAVVEQHNHYLDQMYTGQVRQAVVAAGCWLVAQGVLNTADDLFWLQFGEISDLLRAPSAFAVAPLIATRQADYQSWLTLETPPILGMPTAELPERPPLHNEVSSMAMADGAERPGILHGLGASHGRGQGRARVVTDPIHLPALQAGDILVAPNVGPMWTPLFPILGGLVLERGSVAQHAAATAREYGVPVAIQVKDACRRIADGSWITVDGQSGTVEYNET
ncbi:MAG: PEP/pyruvate-binding domain-containing protein [Caldilineaceae bacterium]